MHVTDDMRRHAREHYGPAMADYLAAAQRLRVGREGLDDLRMVAQFPETGEDRVHVSAERWAGVLRPHAFAMDAEESLAMEPAAALCSGWDLLFVADAVRFGWLA